MLELVAEEEGSVVGHILFSRLIVEAGAEAVAAVALAVEPAFHGTGIGGALIREAHLRLKDSGETLSVVVGDPAYYGRFGYVRARAEKFTSAYQGEAMQALAWGEAPRGGRLVYASAFRCRATAYRLDIEYDGTAYAGWQRQTGQHSVQAAIEQAILAFCGETISLRGAGRTDAGVHATGQVAHVDLSRDWPADTVRDALNAHLGLANEAVVILAATPVDDAFDARFSATGRHYLYRILNRRAPPALEKNRVWWVPKRLDAAAMHEAAQELVGRHDFTTFRSAHCQAKSPVRTLDRLDVTRDGDMIEFRASARSFLHNQVRSMVGTLKRVGEGAWTRRRRRRRAGRPRPRRLRRPGAAGRALPGQGRLSGQLIGDGKMPSSRSSVISTTSETTNIPANTALPTPRPRPIAVVTSRQPSTVSTMNRNSISASLVCWPTSKVRMTSATGSASQLISASPQL